jgi:WD40 repeat protein
VKQRLNSEDRDTQDIAQAQKWTALAYTKPDEAARELAQVLVERLQQQDKAEVFRLTSLVETFAQPLVEAGFQPLLVYAGGVKSYVRGDLERAKEQFQRLRRGGTQAQISGVSLYIPSPSWQLQRTLSGHPEVVQCLAISPDAKILASGSNDKTIKLWRLETGELQTTLKGHSSAVLSISFSPDGKTLASTSNMEFQDATIKLWDVNTGQCKQNLGQSLVALRASSVAFSPDGEYLASGHIDTSICIWHLPSQQLKYTLKGHSWEVSSVAFTPDGQLLVSGGMDGVIMTWNWRGEKRQQIFNVSDNWRGNLIEWFDMSRGSIWDIAISPDGEEIASAHSQQPIKLWSLKRGKLLRTLPQHEGGIYAVAFSPDRETLASGGEENTVKIWNIHTGELLQILPHLGAVKCVVFSPEGNTLVSGGQDKIIKIWKLVD